MPYKISGEKSETARIMVLKESDWSIESNTVISGSGAYEIDGLEEGKKLTLARTDLGEMLGFGNITPEFYESPWPKVLDNPNAYDTSENDFFGYSVAISGDYAIVSAHQEDDAGGTSSGKAYIFNIE